MAVLEYVDVDRLFVEVTDTVTYQSSNRKRIERLPQIFWKNGGPWREANSWAFERATEETAKPKTIIGNIERLLVYANFLECQQLHWFYFPTRRADRCLVRYRGHLIGLRDSGYMAPSVASSNMRTAIMLYRWVRSNGMLDADYPLWRDKQAYIKYFDAIGFERTLLRITTDLSIPNRKPPGLRLEDGLLPISPADREIVLQHAKQNTSEELYRMLAIGFFSGLRLGSICDLKVQTLKNASPDSKTPDLYLLNIGPGARPRVHTKFGVTGQAWIPKALLEDLLDYSCSLRRSKRQSLAAPEDKDLLFLTRSGKPYCERGSGKSVPVNEEMSRFRKSGANAGIKALKKFHFHQTRCTFATELATIALRSGDALNAIAIVKEALLHVHERTSLGYIKFVEQTPTKSAAANDYMKAFSGSLNHD